jgi:hypothetical protein
VDALGEAGATTVLALVGSRPAHPTEVVGSDSAAGGSIEGWLGFVRSAARTFAGRVSVFEIGPEEYAPVGAEADVRALVLKQSALVVRAETAARGAEARIAQAALGPDGLELQRALWARDVAPYVDVLPVMLDAGTEAHASRVRSVLEQTLRHPPAPSVWAYVRGGSAWDAPALAVSALALGASAALFDPATEEQVRWARGVQRTLAGGFAPAGVGGTRFAPAGGSATSRAVVLGRFFNERDFTSLVVYRAPPAGAGEIELVIDSATLRDVRALDLPTGATSRVRNSPARDGTGRAVPVRAGPVPGALLFRERRATPGFELPAEELEVESRRGLTAEEIIARYRLVQQEQDDRLERWMARGRIDFHFKLAQGASNVDLSIDTNYFWERGGELEWEQTGYYLNGNRIPWKRIPELPLIQPEKVITLPLDLTLDKTYVYELAGEERVGDRDAYVIAFEPATAKQTLSLYRGRVWIDRESFARLKASVIQTNLEPPVLTNEEVDRYETRTDADGRAYRMLVRADGQQVWSTAGRSFVVQREVTFTDFRINPSRADFEERRAAAYASRNRMLRDTDEGFRYLERQADGTRVVKPEMDTNQLFLAGGAFQDSSRDSVVPLAGVNYFDFDLWNRDVQFNVLFAGVLGFVTASKPGLGGTRMDLTLDAGLNALRSDDKVFEGDREVEAERIRDRGQVLALRLGVPAGPFFKLNLVGRAAYRQYYTSDEGSAAVADYNDANGTDLAFVLPRDHVEWTGRAEIVFNRRGYTVSAAGSRSRRSDWEAWGLSDGAGQFGTIRDGVFVVTGGEPVRTSFSRFRLGLVKEWFLPRFQKIRGAVDYLDGSRLDRFSRYQFSFFGDDRLWGFSGSGVRFDRGVIGRAGYSFNLFEAIRLDATLESARVEPDASDGRTQSFSGIGVSCNFVGPWTTVIDLSYGYALRSDIPDLEGAQEFLVFVLKLF